MRVSVNQINSLPRGKHKLDTGLILNVGKQKRYWTCRLFLNGKKVEIGIGNFPSIGFKQAKLIKDQYGLLAKQGIDPRCQDTRFDQPDEPLHSVAPKKPELIVPAYMPLSLSNHHSFSMLYEQALEDIAYVKQWSNKKHALQWKTTIERYAIPIIGDIDVSSIDVDHILMILKPIWATKTETASRLRGRLEVLFNYFIKKGFYSGPNPASWKANLDIYLPPTSKVSSVKHFQALTVAQLQSLIRQKLFEGVTYQAICFGAITATRVQEFIRAQWSEINFRQRIWTIQAERMKCRLEHRVPLSDQALRIISAQHRESEYIFCSKGTHLNLDSPRVLIQRIYKGATMHGCRSTFRDWAEDSLIDFRICEAALAHSEGNKTVRAYKRTDLLDARRPVMQRWADLICPMDVFDR